MLGESRVSLMTQEGAETCCWEFEYTYKSPRQEIAHGFPCFRGVGASKSMGCDKPVSSKPTVSAFHFAFLGLLS